LECSRLPLDGGCHVVPHVVERAQLLARLDEWEEHAELWTAYLLEEAAEDVVVVKEVLAPHGLEVLEWLLQLEEEMVQLPHEHRPRHRGHDTRDAVDDL
jgi:hypothetical protein